MCAFFSSRSISSGRPPGEPSRPFAAKVEGTSVCLEWTAPEDNGGHAITGYVVRYGQASSDADRFEVQRINRSTTSHRVAGGTLTPKTSYRFAVAAVNKVGEGDWSLFSDFIQTKTGDGRCTSLFHHFW